ncbi:MAG: hypothetical protein ACU0B7_03565 [Paracoccaceae bacterium]
MFDNIESRIIDRVRSNTTGGVWARSSADRYFIYCVGRSPIIINAFMTWAFDREIGLKPLVGMYKGQSERSFLSNLDQLETISPWLQRQETILELGQCNSNNQPSATLKYLQTGVLEPLGHLKPVTAKVALTHDSWTYDPAFKAHYICA